VIRACTPQTNQQQRSVDTHAYSTGEGTEGAAPHPPATFQYPSRQPCAFENPAARPRVECYQDRRKVRLLIALYAVVLKPPR